MSDNHSKKILKVDRARRKEVAVKVRVKKDYSFRNEVRNLSAVALIINDWWTFLKPIMKLRFNSKCMYHRFHKTSDLGDGQPVR